MRMYILIFASMALSSFCRAETYYLDSQRGNDSNSGKNEASVWRSLERANAETFKAGDRILLKRGSRFPGGLRLKLNGTEEAPVMIEAFGEGSDPVIDAAGSLAGVQLIGSHNVIVRNLEITADGGKTRDGSNPGLRYGVLVQGRYGSTSNITLEDLTIYKIFPEIGSEHEGLRDETYLGTAISIEGNRDQSCTNFVVRNCRIAQVGFKAINLKRIQHVEILDNFMKDIGGPAIQPGNVDDLVVRGNMVDGSGSDMDQRMHARGSGIWPWSSNRILIEKNTFMHARGKGDSCGIHIDFNCSDVVVQYNLSIDNEGGFVEILGNNHNCAYRYNISINDGSREKGKDSAFQDGKILWTSGYVGSKNAKSGPFNSYIYNNTIFVGPNSRSCFSIAPTTEGLLVANNIFHIMGKTENVLGDQDSRKDKMASSISHSVMRNNIFLTDSVLPENLPIKDELMTVGDVRFSKPGGFDAEDYIPRNIALVKDAGIKIPVLEGDQVGLRIGLEVQEDYFGNPIIGNPDIGAIELN